MAIEATTSGESGGATATAAAPSAHSTVTNSAPATVARGRSGPSERQSAARKQLDAVAKGMSEGKFASGQGAVNPEDAAALSGEKRATPTTNSTSQAAEKPADKSAATKAADKAAEKSPEDKKKLAEAKRVLARDGWEPSDFEKFDDVSLIARAEKRRPVQAQIDSMGNELLKARQQPRNPAGQFQEKPAGEGAAAVDAGKAADKPQDQQAQADDDDTDPEIQSILDAAKDVIDEPAAKVLKQMAKVLTAKAGAGNKQAQARVQNAEYLAREMLINQGRERVTDAYPDAMGGEGAFEEVQANWQALAKSGRYGAGQMSKMWDDAAFMAFGPKDTTKQTQREMLARQEAAETGAVDSGVTRKPEGADKQPLKGKAALNYAAELMAKNPGKSPDEIKAMMKGRVVGI